MEPGISGRQRQWKFLNFPGTMCSVPSQGEDVGARIREARERRHWTQEQLASRLKVDRKTVDNWENGRHSPRNRRVIKDLLDVDVAGTSSDEPIRPDLTGTMVVDRTDRHIAAILDNAYLSESDKAMAIQALLGVRGNYWQTTEPSPSQGDTPSDVRPAGEAP